MAINFNIEDVDFKLNESLKIKKLIQSLAQTENKKIGEINYVFCSDEYLLNMNQQYLNHNYFTDVITFDYSEHETLAGDIFISIETVSDNAEEYDVEFEHELHRVMFHGVLHLAGFDDKSDETQVVMTAKENYYLEIFEKLV